MSSRTGCVIDLPTTTPLRSASLDSISLTSLFCPLILFPCCEVMGVYQRWVLDTTPYQRFMVKKDYQFISATFSDMFPFECDQLTC